MLRYVKGCLAPDVSGQPIGDIMKSRRVKELYIIQATGIGKIKGRYEKVPHFIKVSYRHSA
jgi:hypothetical protein